MKKHRFSASGLEIELEVGLSEVVTAHAGAALLVEAARRSEVIAGTDQVLPAQRNPMILADQFRNGNVPASREIARLAVEGDGAG